MGDLIRLVEFFWTFQGEGENWGRRAFFVRMPFCNLKCSWCDTEFNKFTKYTMEQLKEAALMEPSRFAVLTGGEPMLNKDSPRVVRLLKDLGFQIAVETNGTAPIIEGIDFVTISPKADAGYKVHMDALLKAHEIKLVVDKYFDREVPQRFESSQARLTLSPEFNDFLINVKTIEEYIKENPRWRISLQTHKFMKVR